MYSLLLCNISAGWCD
ncbi:hypothetical protein VJW24_24405 [Escherichia coli]|nr:hypothetical protein [Escherichia coli]MEB3546551.1 hypothetical protein [Escherichia coli]